LATVVFFLFPFLGREIFNRPPAGLRKVVIATNIAESSITIDDVVYVIDSGKHKEKTYDAEKNLSMLLPSWVSKASAIQRKGDYITNCQGNTCS